MPEQRLDNVPASHLANIIKMFTAINAVEITLTKNDDDSWNIVARFGND